MADEKESTDTPEMQSVAQTPTSEVQSVGREGSAVSGKSQAVSVTSDKTSDRNESKQLSESGRSSALSSSRGHPASASSQATSSKSAKRKDKIRKSSDDTVHKVTLTVTIAKAIPTVEEEGFKIEDMVKKKKRIVEAPKAQNYYHCSYYLLPDDTDATKTDIVTFGMAAKIYTEHESKVLKTWQEGDHTWVAWSHSHTVTVTKELLLKLFNHTLELRIWDSKDKVSSKARFDRPKAFRLPQAKSGEDPEDVGGVRSLVMKQSQSFIALQPKKSFISRPVPQNGPPGMHNIWKTDAKGRPMRETRATDTSHSIGKDKSTSDTSSKSLIYKSSSQNLRDLDASIVTDHQEAPYTLVSLPINSEQDLPIKSYSRLGRLAGAPDASEVKQMKKHIREQQQKRKEELKKKAPLSAKAKESRESIARLNEKQELQSKESLVHKKERIPASAPPSVGKKGTRETGQHKDSKRHAKKLEVAAAEKAADINKNGNCCIPVQMKILFSGVKSVTNRLDKPVPGIEDVFITVSLDGDLMSESQEQELNPLVIKVNYSDKLPNTPISYDELDRKCQPVYCKYTFYKQPEHKSIGRSHSSTVYWEDTNVVLLGMLDEGSVKEYLNGPPLEIEVHDRDRKAEEVKKEPTLFGEDVEDDKLGNVGMVTGKRTLHNPFTGRDKPWDPYGIAKFQLSDLLLGEKILNLTSPIHSCSIPDQMGFQVARNGRLLGVPNSVDGPRDLPLPMGHYLENNAQLKIRVEITYPLTTPKDLQQKSQMETRPQCPMSRIIYMFQYMNTKFLHHLQGLVTAINARALNLDSMPKHVVEAALSTYKLSEEQQRSCDLDIVTGFHVMDGQIHIFVLEGLRDQAIQQLWQTLPHPSIEDDNPFEVLYNSDMMFSERQYATLDVDLTRVRLHEPLSIIIQQPLLYVRDMVPKPCLDAIIKLDQLTHMKKLRDVARNDLFPTSEMILSLSREFGVPLTTADFEELKEVESETDIDGKHVSVQYAQTSRDWTPIDMYNENYLHYLEERSKYAHKQDYIKQNINNVHEASKTNERVRPKTIAAIPTNGTVHNYSTQYLNSMEQAREKLRQELAKDVHQRFTYCQDYNSSTVVPVNMTQEESVSKDSWRTPDGFIYPGIKNALESNEHIKRPHPAKCDELKEYWRENILHSNILKPTLERDRMTWSERVSDFNLWSKPAGAFDPSVPPTIHHAGDKLAAEQEAAARFELEKWKSKIIVDDTNVHFHRCATDTEQTYRGPKSSNQLDKLQGLLKDEPKKIGLKKSPVLHDIPALSVVLNPSVDTKARHGELPVIDHDNCVNQSHHGYNPGPYQTLSWTLPHNRIPIRDMQHAKFEALKGHDFRLYHKERSVLSRVPIKTLSSEDRNNNLFELGGTEDYRYSSIKSGNICYLQPPPSIKAAPLHTEFYFPDRDKYAEKPTCKKAAAQLAALN